VHPHLEELFKFFNIISSLIYWFVKFSVLFKAYPKGESSSLHSGIDFSSFLTMNHYESVSMVDIFFSMEVGVCGSFLI